MNFSFPSDVSRGEGGKFSLDEFSFFPKPIQIRIVIESKLYFPACFERKGKRCLKTRDTRNYETEKFRYNDRWFQHVQRVARVYIKKREREKSSHWRDKKAGINYHHVYVPLSFSQRPIIYFIQKFKSTASWNN